MFELGFKLKMINKYYAKIKIQEIIPFLTIEVSELSWKRKIIGYMWPQLVLGFYIDMYTLST